MNGDAPGDLLAVVVIVEERMRQRAGGHRAGRIEQLGSDVYLDAGVPRERADQRDATIRYRIAD